MTKAWQLLDTPEKWTQGEMARMLSGEPCNAFGDYAVQWCAIGAIHRVYRQDATQYRWAYLRLKQAVDDLVGWNDDPRRTWQEVRDKLKELDL